MRRHISSLAVLGALALAVTMGAGCASGGSVDDEIDAAPDTPAIDAGIDALTGSGLGEDCTENSDCASGICLKDAPEDTTGVCTEECDGTCPDGYACKIVSIADVTDARVCVLAEDTTCSTCAANVDCGDSGDFCVEFTGGKFCTVDCTNDPTVCPTGFTCQTVSGSGDAITGMQCMPLNGVCCVDGDGDLRGEGDGCADTDCDDANPEVYDDALEVCDGYDNDCVGGVDVDPIDCAGASCQLGQLGYFERAGEPCESGACVPQSATMCGLYTCSDGDENGDFCATACDGEVDDKCIPAAHCDESLCYDDLADGQACDESSDCESDHCQNGFCCSGGDCCQVAQDCPTFGTVAPICETPSTCQGTRGEAVCTTSYSCASTGTVQDDSACDASTLASDCGWFLPVYCTGDVTQNPPTCPSTCSSDADCDAAAFCNPATSVCEEDRADGGVCQQESWCKSDHCQNGFCCAGGDCCVSETDCPASYSGDPVCTVPTSCQGEVDVAQCTANSCTTSAGVDDDSACGAGLEASSCGPYTSIYCTGDSLQQPPQCPTTCTSDSACDASAYCNAGGACVPDEPDGGACNDAAECQSGHCQNGFCCASGDCCNNDSACNDYDVASVCDDATSCQGTRVDGVCNAQKQCTAVAAGDDSGCNGLEANDCGPYPAEQCGAGQDQTAPPCASSCASDTDCDPSAHCDGGTCVPDAGQGGFCDEPSDCDSGLSCVDSVCCNTACNGGCEACDLPGNEGTCTLVGDGNDPDNECGSLSCAGYYWGWTADTCYQKADVSGAEATCNGGGACRTQAQECSDQTTKGGATLTCDDTCQDPDGSTCTGTTAGSCNNVNPGTQTCGTGACQVTVPQCLNGGDNTCTPGAPTSETCNDIDDNCNGAIDEALGDWAESNNSCAELRTLAQAGSDQGWFYDNLNLHSSGDTDYFVARLEETDNDCGCWYQTDEDYYVKVELELPPGVGPYQLCMNVNSCSFSNCIDVGAGSTAVRSQWVDGSCPGDDAYNLYMRVRPVTGAYECVPYKLTYVFDADHCK